MQGLSEGRFGRRKCESVGLRRGKLVLVLVRSAGGRQEVEVETVSVGGWYNR
jgi:hypothetical protein